MKILISHASEDEPAATLLKELIERCSLRRIEVWFSSDQSPSGGIALGASWFSNLLLRLAETDMIVALVTPNSIASPWLYFECGFVANKGKATIVPLTLGLPVADLPMPLSAYQGHDLSASNAIPTFMQKLFTLATVPYDEDMTQPIRQGIARQLLQLSETVRKGGAQSDSVERGDISDLRNYLDEISGASCTIVHASKQHEGAGTRCVDQTDAGKPPFRRCESSGKKIVANSRSH